MQMKKNLIFFKSLDSTQDYLKQNIALPDKTIVVADRQTKGRGRGKRTWSSPKGGLWFSIILKNQLLESSFLNGFSAAIAVTKVLRKKGIGAVLKWPNDVLVQGKKICGILTENIIKGKRISTVVGIGLNVNNDLRIKKSISVKEVTGKNEDLRLMLEEVLYEFFSLNAKDKGQILHEWKRYWEPYHTKIFLSGENRFITGDAEGIDDDGRLLLRTEDKKKVVTISLGEII